jgi:hypothetical protein
MKHTFAEKNANNNKNVPTTHTTTTCTYNKNKDSIKNITLKNVLMPS